MLVLIAVILIWCGICQFFASRKGEEETYYWRNWLFAGYWEFSSIKWKYFSIYFNRFEEKFIPFMLEYDDGFAIVIFNISFYFKKDEDY